MNITLEEQIEYMREELLVQKRCIAHGFNSTGLRLIQAILATLEACRDEKAKPVKYGCHVDLARGAEPDGCVIDTGDYDDCVHAVRGMKKEQCGYWLPIKQKAKA